VEQGWCRRWNDALLNSRLLVALMASFEAQLLVLHLGFGGSATFHQRATPPESLGSAFLELLFVVRVESGFVDLACGSARPGL